MIRSYLLSSVSHPFFILCGLFTFAFAFTAGREMQRALARVSDPAVRVTTLGPWPIFWTVFRKGFRPWFWAYIALALYSGAAAFVGNAIRINESGEWIYWVPLFRKRELRSLVLLSISYPIRILASVLFVWGGLLSGRMKPFNPAWRSLILTGVFMAAMLPFSFFYQRLELGAVTWGADYFTLTPPTWLIIPAIIFVIWRYLIARLAGSAWLTIDS